jgi:hypothetical protein
VPYLAKRLTYASTVNPKLTPRVLQNLLGSLRRLYYETAMSANPSTLIALASFVSTGHILFGADYPLHARVGNGRYSPRMLVRPSAQMGVYQITGPGRVYIGSSDDIPRRWHSHLSQLRGGRHHNYRLQAAWTEYGEAAFAFVVIEEVADLTDLIGAEQRQLNAALAARPVYYLALDISTPARGLVHTAESRLKMSTAIKASMTPDRLAAMRKHVSGDRNPAAKLTAAVVVDICQRLVAGGHPAEIAAEYEVTESLVYQIRRGQIWTHIVTPETVTTMRAIRQNGWAGREITQEMRDRFREVGRPTRAGRHPPPHGRSSPGTHAVRAIRRPRSPKPRSRRSRGSWPLVHGARMSG